jgi:hypothetical protein
MEATEGVVKVYSKVTGIARSFTLTQWALLPKVARLEWQQGTPEEAQEKNAVAPTAAMLPTSLEAQIAAGVAKALKELGLSIPEAETPEQKTQRLIKEGVASSLSALGFDAEAIAKMQAGNQDEDEDEVEGDEDESEDEDEVDYENQADPEALKQAQEAGKNPTPLHTGTDGVPSTDASATAAVEAVRQPVVIAANAVAQDTDAAAKLTEARVEYEALYPGQKAGQKQLQTLLDAIALKKSQAN